MIEIFVHFLNSNDLICSVEITEVVNASLNEALGPILAGQNTILTQNSQLAKCVIENFIKQIGRRQ